MEGFGQEEREIFQYFNGQKNVFIDPMELRRNIILAFDGDPGSLVDSIKSDIPQLSLTARAEFMQKCRQAFKMPWDYDTGVGALETEVLNAWRLWNEFIEDVKKKPDGSVMSSQPTPSVGTSPSSSPTEKSLDCGCTSHG